MPALNVPRAGTLALVCAASLLAGCTMPPAQLAYRERLEQGFITPEDTERFKTPDAVQLALVADARAPVVRQTQAIDLALIEAAAGADVAAVRDLLTRGAQVNATDTRGSSPLLSASREGAAESARLLIKAGADVNGRSGSMTPLSAAALRGHTAVVRLLVRSGADVNAVGANGLSALMNAVKLNRLETVKVLLQAGASMRTQDRAGDHLLAVAVSKNYPDMLALLLRQGVPPDLADSNGLTALYWAQYLKRPELVQLLREAGASPERMKTDVMVSQPYDLGGF